ncbi:helix-turn-helix domain-containing protein [Nocardioides sp. NPDC057764]|uniref:helix-turn-helix domain-containing protein n=1 Tax=Nocardioides sp. NPDC057764 TaxID=3346243 RepID=UPI00367135B3
MLKTWRFEESLPNYLLLVSSRSSAECNLRDFDVFTPLARSHIRAIVTPASHDQGGSSTEQTSDVAPASSSHIELKVDGVEVPVESNFEELIRLALDVTAAGKSLAVVDTDGLEEDRELTSQQAADYLNISRAYLVRIAKAGKLPFSMVGTHHRFRMSDVLAYEEQARQTRSDALAAMVPEGGYDEDDI